MGNATKTYTYENDDGEPVSVHLPASWHICGTCGGNGAHSRHLGSFTEEERDEAFDDEGWDRYMSGGYDRSCEDCGGSGKVLDFDEDAIPDHIREQMREDAKFEREYAAAVAAERRMGA